MRLYTLLLHLFPASFRMEYGEEMRQIFAERLSSAKGPPHIVVLWAGEFREILCNAIVVHYDVFYQDLRFAWRTLRRIPGFALTVVIVTALGIGANAAVFSIVDPALIRSLPYSEADQIVHLWATSPAYSKLETSPANLRDWRNSSKSFVNISAYFPYELNMSGSGDPARLPGAFVNATFFHALGVQPEYGRSFRPEDDRPGAPGTVLISNELWRTTFKGRPEVLGKKIFLDGETFELIGILPEGFHFPSAKTRFWIPFRFKAADFESRTDENIYAIARLKKDVSLEDAQAEMTAIAGALERQYPETNTGSGIRVERLRDVVTKRERLQLGILCAASFCLLLIACTNLANLFIVRAMGRAEELALRAALGAGRERLVRQLLTETLVLTAAGGFLGMIVAAGITPLLEIFVPRFLPIGPVSIWNFRVFVFSATLTLLIGLVFGTIPAMQIWRRTSARDVQAVHPVLHYRSRRFQSVLVTMQVTASVILLVSSGLLIHALWRVQSVNPGFSPESVFTAQTALPMPKYDRVEKRVAFYSRVLSEISTFPGVTSASYVSFLPMVMSGGVWQVSIGKGTVTGAATSPRASLRYVTTDFFKTLGIPIHSGRDVMESDTLDSPYVAVVSQSFADRFLPGKNPIGQTFNIAFEDRKVIGVVGDIRVRGPELNSEPQVYLPHRQVADGWLTDYSPRFLAVKSSRNPDALLEAVRKAVQKADPEVPVSDPRALSDIVNSATDVRRTQVLVFCVFGGLSLFLAGTGIYGIVAFTVSQRAREIGIRIALGATRSLILRMIFRQAFKILVLGSAAGIALGYIAGRLMQSLLAGISPADYRVLIIACFLAAFAAIVGSLAPAIRAVKIEPLEALRNE